MKPTKIIFIHGNGCTTWMSNWSPWLKKELDNLGYTTVFKTFPDSEIARKKFWLPFLHNELKPDENTLLIGWSSGAVAAMRYAEKYKILGSILIAPCYTDLGLESERISGWYDEKWNWEKIKANQNKICLFYSQNDELIPFEEFEHVREQLNPDEVYEFPKHGHFIHIKQFPEVVQCVRKYFK